MTLRRFAPVVLALLLAGCSAGVDRPGGELNPNDWKDSGEVRNGVLVYPASDFHQTEGGRPGGTLRASVQLDTNTFDVHAISHGNTQWLGRLIYDALVYQDEAGNISPWLAKSWSISPDGKTYTFHLRDDVTFSDGTRFNAEAVLLNLEHMRDPATKSPLAAFYIRPYKSGRVVDEYTFEATLSEPYVPFLDVLAQSWLSMISPKQIRENPKSIAEHPIGSGPFILTRYEREKGATFVRRPDYNWSPTVIRHKGPAYLDGIRLDIIPDAMSRYWALGRDEHDFTLDAPAPVARQIRADPNLIFRTRVRKGNPFRSITFNVERPPFDDVRIRRALALAIDRDGLARILGFGVQVPKSDFLAANTRHYDPAFTEALAYDVKAANRLFDEAGWSQRDAEGYRVKDGRRLEATLMIAEAGGPPQLPVAVQSDARKVGFDLKLEIVPAATAMERRRRGDFDAGSGGYWHTNTPDGLTIMYHSSAVPSATVIGQNGSRLRDRQLDGLLDAARQTTDQAEQQRLYSAAQRRLTELVPAVPSTESHHMIAYNKRVRGVIFDTSHNTPLFVGVWLEDPAKVAAPASAASPER
ncbi:ABC transporter substrate-binding protein [Sandaracinobacter sp. RS1-74]|uniref:ABC transporter substrate-binding protein n=1 Tax=Sandaracinobacteroides sayramensis TaxID=2913411 RepID=UPI001EDC7B3B|nr:ABC transporter substrate-binding protein [Sandaracinobacteroides sayramensis]MCG2842442.1 ABC transporter substrate-binding protein [Sandaracinobacteroides sayramensis]